jgi:hypothetical protein
MSGPAPEDHDEGGSGSSRASIAALVAIVVLALLGYWAFNAMDQQRKLQNCIDSGRRNCTDVGTPGK